MGNAGIVSVPPRDLMAMYMMEVYFHRLLYKNCQGRDKVEVKVQARAQLLQNHGRKINAGDGANGLSLIWQNESMRMNLHRETSVYLTQDLTQWVF